MPVTRTPRPAFATLISLVSLLASGVRAAELPTNTVELQRLEPTPLLLQAPANVTGTFDVAATAPTVDFAVLPGQWQGGKLWSSWGDCVCASDGNYYASTGDHDGPHGHTYLYRVDPALRTASLVTDVNHLLGLTNTGDYAAGKIHAPIIDAGNGSLFFATYRGAPPGPTFKGDWILRYDLASGTAESWGVMVTNMSVASMVYHRPSRMIYGLAVPPMGSKEPAPAFIAYSLDRTGVVFACESKSRLSRACFADADGNAYWDSEGSIARYTPADGRVTPTTARVPGNGALRAASATGRDGVAYGISSDGLIFAFDTRTASIREMDRVFVAGPGYTATCRLDPTGQYLYYLPGSHGGTSLCGTPVVQMNLRTGRRKVLAFLQKAVAEQFHYALGGSFGFVLNPDGSQMMVNWNGTDDPKKKNFGTCSVMLLNIPASER